MSRANQALENPVNSYVLFCLLNDKRVFFGLFDQKKVSNFEFNIIVKRPPKTPLKFDSGSFETIKKFSKIFFTGSLTGSGSEIHRFYQATEVIWVEGLEATSSYYQFLQRISGSL